MDYVLIFSSCFKCIQLIVLCQHLDHLAVVRSADLFGHFLAPSVWLVVTRGTLNVGRVTLRLKPGPAHRLARGAVVVRVVLALLQCQHVTVLAQCWPYYLHQGRVALFEAVVEGNFFEVNLAGLPERFLALLFL